MHENVFAIITHQGKVNYMRCLLSANLMGVFRRSDSLHFKVNGIIVAIVWKADLKGIKHNREIVFSKLSHIQEEWQDDSIKSVGECPCPWHTKIPRHCVLMSCMCTRIRGGTALGFVLEKCKNWTNLERIGKKLKLKCSWVYQILRYIRDVEILDWEKR